MCLKSEQKNQDFRHFISLNTEDTKVWISDKFGLQTFTLYANDKANDVDVAAFGPRDPGSNPGQFAASNSNR